MPFTRAAVIDRENVRVLPDCKKCPILLDAQQRRTACACSAAADSMAFECAVTRLRVVDILVAQAARESNHDTVVVILVTANHWV